MTINSMALISNLIYMAMSIVIIIRNARLIGKNSRSITAVFFTLSTCSMLLSYIYWLAYEILRPGIRMPFAANEAGEMAINLLLASVLVTVFGMNKISSYKEAAFGIAFQIACVLLWIGWSGEWVQDILSGLILCYLVFMTVKALIISGAFNRREWQFQGISLGLLAVLQGMTFLLEGNPKVTLDVICYIFTVSVGLAILFNRNASSGGLDIVAKVMNKYLHIELGKAMSAAGMCIALSSAFFYDSKTVVLSVLGTYLNGIVLDHFIFDQSVKRRVCIVSEKSDEIRNFILKELHSGASVYRCIGALRMNEQEEIITIVSKSEYQQLMNYLQKTDPTAFVTVYKVNDMRYIPKSPDYGNDA